MTATPRPWEWADETPDHARFPEANGLRGADGKWVLTGDAVGAAGRGWINGSDEDKTLIVEAVNAYEPLQARIRELEEALRLYVDLHSPPFAPCGCGPCKTATALLTPPSQEKPE